MKIAIVCVDDDILILNSIKSVLEDLNGNDYMISTAIDSEEAIELVNDLLKDGYHLPVAIVDYIMPGMKGDKLLEIIHSMSSKTRNILLTGQATTEGVQNAVNNAALYRYISKPWGYDDFLMTVKEAIKSYLLELELEKERLELKKANEELVKLDHAKSYFLGLISHEINTPLFSISGFTDIIKSELKDDKMKEYIDIIEESVERLKRFARYSLLTTRLVSQQYKLDMKETSVHDILISIIEIVERKFHEKNLKIIDKCKQKDQLLMIDTELIELGIKIIVENACKFSSVDGIIEINDKIDKGYYFLTISDNGPGFKPLGLKHVFDMFFTDELMNHQEGLGLGLAMVKIIMDQHSASISIRNKKRRGAEITLKFPIG